jgi:hypothetical protein
MRRWVKRLLLLLGALALALVAAECWLRRYGDPHFPGLETVYPFYEDDGQGSVQPVASWRGTHVVQGRRVTIELNDGLRGPPFPRKAPGEFRVLFLGDSFPFGHGVEAHEAFPALAAERLAAALGRSVVAGNAGIPGATFGEQLHALRRHRVRFEPDLVVSCFYTGNDFDGDFAGPKVAIDGYWFFTQAARLLQSSFRARLALNLRLWFLLEQQLGATPLRMDRSAALPTPDEVARFAGFPARRDEGLYMDAIAPHPITHPVLDRLESTLRALRDESGGQLVVVILPSFALCMPGVFEAVLASWGESPSAYRAGLGAVRLAERCGRLGIHCVDLVPHFATHPRVGELFLDVDLHLSFAGHRFVAEHLVPGTDSPSRGILR